MDNASFGDDRYRSFPRLVSGPGPRGYAALYKNRLVKAVIKQFDISSIVDIGCGDLCWLDEEILASCSHVGLDISAVAIERATAAYPSLLFAGRYSCGASRAHLLSDGCGATRAPTKSRNRLSSAAAGCSSRA